MRNGQNKRMRGRNRKGQNPLTRVYESNGPDVKIRGTPNHVADKYVQLARDAQASGDPVAAENYFQHAEHYFRLIAAAQEQFRQSHPYFRPEGEQRDDHFDAGEEDAGGQPMAGEMSYGGQPQPYPPHPPREAQPYPQQQPYPPRESQHYGRPQPPAQQGRPEGGDPGLPAFISSRRRSRSIAPFRRAASGSAWCRRSSRCWRPRRAGRRAPSVRRDAGAGPGLVLAWFARR